MFINLIESHVVVSRTYVSRDNYSNNIVLILTEIQGNKM